MNDLLFETPDNSPATGRYARVAVERSIDRLDDDGTLTYAVPGADPEPGTRVEVPLGKGSRATPGIVVCVGGRELLEGLSPGRVKSISRVGEARLTPELMRLASWMSGYYVCPLGMTLAAMMPAAVKRGTGKRRVERVELAPGIVLDAAQELPVGIGKSGRRVWERLVAMGAFPAGATVRDLAMRMGLKTVAPIRKLAASGVLRITHEDKVVAALRATPSVEAPGRPDAVTLTPEQLATVEGIDTTRGFGVHLLRGVTGSGKTEVYLRLIERVLERGQSAVVLVPEIALTPQAAERFTTRFGPGVVAVLHSGLRPAERHRAWARAASGEARVVVGARSAVFAPVTNLGLVVVDEEHDSSYKQDRLPRYHGRDTAIQRAHLAGCPVVLGSATPSMESWANAQRGKYRLWTLTGRVGGATLPEVRVVSLADERRVRVQRDPGDTRLHLVGPTLEAALERTLRGGGQAILLLNRRGLAQYVWCRSAACGYVLSCDHCDAGLVVHRAREVPAGGVVRCHHCDAAQRVPTLCPGCGSKLALFGWGTQRAEEEVAEKFGALGLEIGRTLLRVDSDEMKSAGAFHAALARFASGEARVLLGTQMIAKGLDFPNVRLVGVLDADTALHQPDFRACERTFQLVSQVAGRAGRGAHAGLVVVQTMMPTEPAIALAARHDYVSFATGELATRARAKLPPATRLARIVCRDQNAAKARSAAETLTARLRREAGVEVFGPYVPALSRVAGYFRVAIDVRSDRSGPVQAALGAARRDGMLTSDSHTAVDVDPVSLI
ncbi:MAG: primosomal protein N' [Phycisphaerae bacterium]|nr:MAG: primosomal protein N' [Phycisphaerae bacterium]